MIDSLRAQNVELGERLTTITTRAQHLEKDNTNLRAELEALRLTTQLTSSNTVPSPHIMASNTNQQVQLLKALLLVQNVDVETHTLDGNVLPKKMLLNSDVRLMELKKQVRVLRHTLYILRAQVVQLQLSIPQTSDWVARSVENALK
jgi:hypothetical protein|tara:strand:+ start:58 stop:498 length:441 start_codon:yes stop_codon:yes gene_type:complete